jgi:hypothetical protein
MVIMKFCLIGETQFHTPPAGELCIPVLERLDLGQFNQTDVPNVSAKTQGALRLRRQCELTELSAESARNACWFEERGAQIHDAS